MPSETKENVLSENNRRAKDMKSRDSEKWDLFDVNKWRAAMFRTRGYFKQLYEDTPKFALEMIRRFKANNPDKKDYPVRVIEVGSGTGEFLFSLVGDVETLVGVEFNNKFVSFCEEKRDAEYGSENLAFILGDAQELVSVLKVNGQSPLKEEIVIIACVNNTFGIMPDDMRHKVYLQIVETLQLNPANSLFLGTYWDGNHFGNSVQNFYGANPVLCGDLKGAVIDWERHIMTTTSGYTTRWTSPEKAFDVVSGYGITCSRIEAKSRGVLVEGQLNLDHISNENDETFDLRELTTESEGVAQDYYDSDDAFNFYTEVWGGDNIHVGLYDETATLGVDDQVKRVQLASIRVLEVLSSKIPISPNSLVMDMGSALGGCSRYLARNFGCKVVGVDLSKKECQVNVQKTTRAGLDHLVDVKCASFTDTGEESGTYDIILSEDSFLHAGEYRAGAVEEAARLLKPGGYFIFTDIMEADDVDKSALQPIYNRIHLSSMGSVEFYKSVAQKYGLKFVSFDQMTQHLVTHYSTIQQILREKKDKLIAKGVSTDYIKNMDAGLSHWVCGGGQGLLNYGILLFQKPTPSIQDLALKAQIAAEKALECAKLAEKLAEEQLQQQQQE